MIQGIDPLLYRNHGSDIQKKVQAAQSEATGLSFEEYLKREVPENLQGTVSSDTFSPVPGKREVLLHIGDNPGRRKLYEAAEEFEGYFLEKMFREMKKNIPKGGLIDGGYAEEIFDEMLLTERVGKMAHEMEFGLAESIYSQMQRFTSDR